MRKIAVVTTSRADYGLLRQTLKVLRADRRCAMQLVVGGSHLSRASGRTIDEIRADGLRVAATVDTPVRGDSGAAAASAMGAALGKFAAAFAKLRPDLVVVIGDRYEMLAAASAAVITGNIVAHLHGGEVTAGSLDEGWRHAITKISHLHLVTTREFANRVAAMGEPRRNIRVVGSPGVEALRHTSYLTRGALAEQLGFPLPDPIAVVTYHPVTNDPTATRREFDALMSALERSSFATIVATWPNADPGSSRISDGLLRAARRDPRLHVVRSLGSQRYHSLMKLAQVMVGNSSSGIIEAPSLGLPVVNVGMRQAGRPRGTNVIDVLGDRASLERALARARGAAFRTRARQGPNPYDGGRTSERVRRFLMTVELTSELRQKAFVDGRAARSRS
jgi:UDP-N-acetylglucosamine 2-epimerase (non-hydrolysing)